MRQQDGHILTSEGQAAVKAILKKKKVSMRRFWQEILKRPSSNWHHAIGSKGRSVSLATIEDILTGAKLEFDARYYARVFPPPKPLSLLPPGADSKRLPTICRRPTRFSPGGATFWNNCITPSPLGTRR